MTWTVPAPEPINGPLVGEDRPILEAYLAYQRAELINICAGLTAEQLAERPSPPSTLSLLGLIRHLAKVERTWFRQRAAGQPVGPLFDDALGKDHDFAATDPTQAAADFARLEEEIRLADEAVELMPFDAEFEVHGAPFSLRMVYVHMIGEYARHNGHADLLREAIDGVTGR